MKAKEDAAVGRREKERINLEQNNYCSHAYSLPLGFQESSLDSKIICIRSKIKSQTRKRANEKKITFYVIDSEY